MYVSFHDDVLIEFLCFCLHGWAPTYVRFEDDFFIDLIFAPVTNQTPSSTADDDDDDSTAADVSETSLSGEGLSSSSSSTGDASSASSDGTAGAPGDAAATSSASSAANGDATSKAQTAGATNEKEDEDNGTGAMNSALLRRERGIVVDPAASTAYDAMLHRDGKMIEHTIV